MQTNINLKQKYIDMYNIFQITIIAGVEINFSFNKPFMYAINYCNNNSGIINT